MSRHGLSYTAEYRAWQTMRLRCNNPRNRAYPSYGGRGIKVCDRWLNSVEAFLADMGPKPSPAHEIDRRDNDGDYTPDNCRWTTRKINDRNRRNNRHIEINGETLTLVEWSERYAVRSETISERIDRGWLPELAVTTPARRKLPKGQRQCYTHPCSACGSPTQGARCRSCENRSRARDEHSGQYLRANFQHESRYEAVA